MEHPGKAVAKRMLSEGGYRAHGGSDIHADAEPESIAGAMPKMKLKGGGRIKGHGAKSRMDRRARGGSITECEPDDDMGNNVKDSGRARGGHVKGKGGKTVINVNAGGEGKDPQHDQQIFQAGAQQGAKAIAQKMAGAGGPPGGAPMGPPHPPAPAMPPPGMGPGGPPPGAPPPGAMPPQRPPMMPPAGGMPMHARGGALRDSKGRFLGGAV